MAGIFFPGGDGSDENQNQCQVVKRGSQRSDLELEDAVDQEKRDLGIRRPQDGPLERAEKEIADIRIEGVQKKVDGQGGRGPKNEISDGEIF